MKIAIFGGSFDPPHKGHLQIMELVLNKLDIDRLIILVAYKNPFKKNYRIEARKRLEWLESITSKYDKIICSDYEILQDKVITSIQSIRYFESIYKPSKLYFVLGQDNFLQVDKWNEFNTLKTKVEFIVIQRDLENMQDYKKELMQSKTSKEVCMQYASELDIKMQFLSFCYNNSSSKIIQDISNNINEIPSNIYKDVLESYK